MWGFHLKRGDTIVYNLTGEKPGHPFMSAPVPKWAQAMDGLEIDAVIKNLKVDDQAKQDLVTACRYELARYARSRSKLHGETCRAHLWVRP